MTHGWQHGKQLGRTGSLEPVEERAQAHKGNGAWVGASDPARTRTCVACSHSTHAHAHPPARDVRQLDGPTPSSATRPPTAQIPAAAPVPPPWEPGPGKLESSDRCSPKGDRASAGLRQVLATGWLRPERGARRDRSSGGGACARPRWGWDHSPRKAMRAALAPPCPAWRPRDERRRRCGRSRRCASPPARWPAETRSLQEPLWETSGGGRLRRGDATAVCRRPETWGLGTCRAPACTCALRCVGVTAACTLRPQFTLVYSGRRRPPGLEGTFREHFRDSVTGPVWRGEGELSPRTHLAAPGTWLSRIEAELKASGGRDASRAPERRWRRARPRGPGRVNPALGPAQGGAVSAAPATSAGRGGTRARALVPAFSHRELLLSAHLLRALK